MKKLFVLAVVCLLALSIFAGCTGTIVVVGDCTCPTNGQSNPTQPPVNLGEGAVKTGLAIVTDISGSKNAEIAKFDVTLVAVLVNDEGVIVDCIIDGIGVDMKFDATGTITTELSADIATKNEKGDSYGMVAWGGAKAEWYQQAEALANYVIGKTAAEVAGIAVNEDTKPANGTDLATSVTIKIGGYVDAIVEAVANAKHLGAQSGDELILASLSNTMDSKAATAGKDGTAQLNCDATALTVNNGKITSCYIDSVQAKVSFNASGVITTDLNAQILTKNELGAAYGMVSWGGAKAEWNEQAASFAAYVRGKTAAEVAGISVSESTQPADGTDLATTVTIKIGDFMDLIAKAMA